MAKSSEIRERSFEFAIRIVNAYQYLINKKKEFVLSKQLLRCGTSIGANLAESIGAQSNADFMAKISLSYKESIETIFWIRLLEATDYFTKKEASSLLTEATEISKILGSIQMTLRAKT